MIRRAIRHLLALREYIAKDSPDNAMAVAEQILKSVGLLAAQPQMGRPGRILGTRELVIPGLPRIIPYRVRGDDLQLLAVFHGRQNWKFELYSPTAKCGLANSRNCPANWLL